MSPACGLSQEHGLVVAGGVDNYQDQSAVESTLDGEAIGSLPQMPVGKSSHCLVALAEGDLFMSGGSHCDFTCDVLEAKRTHVYRAGIERWTETRYMPTARYGHMCGLVTAAGGSPAGVSWPA